MRLVTGMRVRAVIAGVEINDAKLYVEGSSRIYICQNDMDGSTSPDRLGYRCSWIVTGMDINDHTTVAGRDRVNKFEVITEGTNMEQTTTPATFIRLEKNTELFTKGSVFERCGSYYAPLDRKTVYIDENQRNVSDAYVSLETVARLGEKVFAPVTKFNPAFVTADENERLQAALKAPAAKKATAKKATK